MPQLVRLKSRHWPEVVPDAQLALLALQRGPASAEAYLMLELREARSAGDRVAALRANGRYTIGAAPD